MKNILFLILFAAVPMSSFAKEGDQWNVQFSPILLLIGGIQGSLDYKLNENIVVGPYFEYLNVEIFDVKIRATAIGANGKYHFDSVFKDGWFVKGILASTSAKAEAEDSLGDRQTASASGTFYAVGGGYHWFWDSFNLNLGMLLGGFSYDKITVEDSNGDEVESYTPARVGVDFNLGFTF